MGDKLMALGKCKKPPTVPMLAAQPRWCFSMRCAEFNLARHSNPRIPDWCRDTPVITRERLPKFKSNWN